MTDPPEVMVLGDVAVDWTVNVSRLPEPDSLVLARSCTRFAGGSAANVAVGLTRLGHPAGFIGQVGDDEDGRFLLKAFRDEGVDIKDVVTLTEYETPSTVVMVDERGTHMIVVLPRDAEAHRLQAPDLSRVARADAIHIGPSHTAVARDAAMRAREGDAQVFYAPGGVARFVSRADLWPVLELTDALFVSRSEAVALTDRSSPAEATRALLDTGPDIVVETVGAEGAFVASGNGVRHIPPLPIPPTRDTTGAGAAFAAGFIAAWLRGFDWDAAAHLGGTAAALTIQHLGARTGLPGWEETLAAAPGVGDGGA
mgnify:CR=1 FL=1